MTITDTHIATLLDRHGLGPLRSWRRLERGEVNPTYIVNGDMVLRLNAREPDTIKFRKEAAIYRQLAHETNLPVPRVLALDTCHDLLPCDLLLLERLEGRNGLDLWPMLDAAAKEQISYELGRTLATLHERDYRSYGGFDEATGSMGESDNWRTYLLDKAAEILLELWQRDGLPAVLLYGAEDYLLRAALPHRPPAVLVHGDFGLHNILLAPDGGGWRISGLFDFEWALAGDAEYEFATGLLVEPDEVNPLARPFMQGYRSLRPLDEGWEHRSAVYRLVYHLALCAVVCRFYSGDVSMLRYHRGMIVDILKEWV
jgi:hygromycin-B 7''-O-kinase